MKFFIVDAFTEHPFGGNTAGIVILPDNAGFPTEETMQKTARELRYSETAFLQRTGAYTFAIRYFTPAAEVQICGHATIAAFTALLQINAVTDNTCYKINTPAGKLSIALEDGRVFMEMGNPSIGSRISNRDELREIYSIMGADYDRLTAQGLETLPEIASTGLSDLLLPVDSIGSLETLAPDMPRLAALSRKYGVVGVHAYTFNCNDATAHVRNFSPLYGIDEEAATGTSNATLTYSAYQSGKINADALHTFIQGERMERPSKVLTKLEIAKGRVSIWVGGKGAILAEGTINLG